ncbi:hypothetical protein ABPG72_014274 [Tetrahymena utriculariae]
MINLLKKFSAAEYSRISPFLSNFSSELSRGFMFVCFFFDILMLYYSLKLIFKKYEEHQSNQIHNYYIRYYSMIYYYVYFQFKSDMIGSGFFCVINPHLSYTWRCKKSIFAHTPNSIDFQISLFASLIILVANTIIAGIANSKFILTDRNNLKEGFGIKIYIVYLIEFFYFQSNFLEDMRSIIFVTAIGFSFYNTVYYFLGYGPQNRSLRLYYGSFHMASILTNILISLSYFQNNYLNEDLHFCLICIMTLFIFAFNYIYLFKKEQQKFNFQINVSTEKSLVQLSQLILELANYNKSSQTNPKDYILLMGKLRFHLNICKSPTCICHTDFEKYIFNNNQSADINQHDNIKNRTHFNVINDFIEQQFQQILTKIKSLSSKDQEKIISNYTQFLFFFAGKKMESTMLLKQNVYSSKSSSINMQMIEQILSQIQKDELIKSKSKMRYSLDRQSVLNANRIDQFDQYILTQPFIEEFKEILRSLIKKKKEIFNKLIEGYNTSTEAFIDITDLIQKQEKILAQIKEQMQSTPQNIYFLKFQAIIFTQIICDPLINDKIEKKVSDILFQDKYMKDNYTSQNAIIHGDLSHMIISVQDTQVQQKMLDTFILNQFYFIKMKIESFSQRVPTYFEYSNKDFQKISSPNQLIPSGFIQIHNKLIQQTISSDNYQQNFMQRQREVFLKTRNNRYIQSQIFLNYYPLVQEKICFYVIFQKFQSINGCKFCFQIDSQLNIQAYTDEFAVFMKQQLKIQDLNPQNLIGVHFSVLSPNFQQTVAKLNQSEQRVYDTINLEIPSQINKALLGYLKKKSEIENQQHKQQKNMLFLCLKDLLQLYYKKSYIIQADIQIHKRTYFIKNEINCIYDIQILNYKVNGFPSEFIKKINTQEDNKKKIALQFVDQLQGLKQIKKLGGENTKHKIISSKNEKDEENCKLNTSVPAEDSMNTNRQLVQQQENNSIDINDTRKYLFSPQQNESPFTLSAKNNESQLFNRIELQTSKLEIQKQQNQELQQQEEEELNEEDNQEENKIISDNQMNQDISQNLITEEDIENQFEGQICAEKKSRISFVDQAEKVRVRRKTIIEKYKQTEKEYSYITQEEFQELFSYANKRSKSTKTDIKMQKSLNFDTASSNEDSAAQNIKNNQTENKSCSNQKIINEAENQVTNERGSFSNNLKAVLQISQKTSSLNFVSLYINSYKAIILIFLLISITIVVLVTQNYSTFNQTFQTSFLTSGITTPYSEFVQAINGIIINNSGLFQMGTQEQQMYYEFNTKLKTTSFNNFTQLFQQLMNSQKFHSTLEKIKTNIIDIDLSTKVGQEYSTNKFSVQIDESLDLLQQYMYQYYLQDISKITLNNYPQTLYYSSDSMFNTLNELNQDVYNNLQTQINCINIQNSIFQIISQLILCLLTIYMIRYIIIISKRVKQLLVIICRMTEADALQILSQLNFADEILSSQSEEYLTTNFFQLKDKIKNLNSKEQFVYNSKNKKKNTYLQDRIDQENLSFSFQYLTLFAVIASFQIVFLTQYLVVKNHTNSFSQDISQSYQIQQGIIWYNFGTLSNDMLMANQVFNLYGMQFLSQDQASQLVSWNQPQIQELLQFIKSDYQDFSNNGDSSTKQELNQINNQNNCVNSNIFNEFEQNLCSDITNGLLNNGFYNTLSSIQTQLITRLDQNITIPLIEQYFHQGGGYIEGQIVIQLSKNIFKYISQIIQMNYSQIISNSSQQIIIIIAIELVIALFLSIIAINYNKKVILSQYYYLLKSIQIIPFQRLSDDSNTLNLIKNTLSIK